MYFLQDDFKGNSFSLPYPQTHINTLLHRQTNQYIFVSHLLQPEFSIAGAAKHTQRPDMESQTDESVQGECQTE